ncbi:MAG: hypothetical protein M1831_007299 [Alyxoria varia]|nr:MAG: hypothetical protein M1831_007299 [Alyxoria varia]
MASHSSSSWSFSDVEYLVGRFNQQPRPQDFEAIETQLQAFQRDESGWQLADSLLTSGDNGVRFFGALTFLTKLNQSGSSLTVEQIYELRARILKRIIEATRRPNDSVVLTKLFGVVSRLISIPQSPWRRPLKDVTTCMILGSGIGDETLYAPTETIFDDNDQWMTLLFNLSAQDSSICLTFATILAEDMLVVPSHQRKVLIERELQNLVDIVPILDTCFSKADISSSSMTETLFPCYLAWITYAKDPFVRPTDEARTVFKLLPRTPAFLTKEESSQSAMEFFIELFNENGSYVQEDTNFKILELLQSSNWAKRHLAVLDNAVANPDQFETDQDIDEWEQALCFGRMVLAFGQFQIVDLFHEFTVTSGNAHERFKCKDVVLPLVQRLIPTQYYKTIDERLSGAIIDFWDNFVVDAMSHSSLENTDELLKPLLEALTLLCFSARLPVVSEFSDQDPNEPMVNFRTRIKDFIQSAYEEFGVAILKALVDITMATSEANSSLEAMCVKAEPSLYFVRGLADFMQDYAEEDQELERLFGSGVFTQIISATPPNRVGRVKRLAISCLGEFSDFFERNEDHLLTALSILFPCLEDQEMAPTAAHSIADLCDRSRSSLIMRLPDLVAGCERLFEEQRYNYQCKADLCRSVASVTQATFSQERKVRTFDSLMDLLEKDFEARLSEGQQSNTSEELVDCARHTLYLLLGISRASQIPDDDGYDPVGLDEPDAWTTEHGRNIQGRILSLVKNAIALDANASSRPGGSVFTEACAIFKAGYREYKPGPFVFQPSVTVDFVTSLDVNDQRQIAAAETASTFVASHSGQDTATKETVWQLVTHVCRVTSNLQHPRNDPLLATVCMQFFEHLTSRNVAILTSSDEFIKLSLNFSLQCLQSPEAGPRGQAATFLASLVSVQNSTPDVEKKVSEIVDSFGEKITTCLINCFGGDASRSELDRLSTPFRELVGRYPTARTWIERALAAPEFPSQGVENKDKRMFAQQVLLVRGGYKMKNVVREFWALCRGTVADYGGI